MGTGVAIVRANVCNRGAGVDNVGGGEMRRRGGSGSGGHRRGGNKRRRGRSGRICDGTSRHRKKKPTSADLSNQIKMDTGVMEFFIKEIPTWN